MTLPNGTENMDLCPCEKRCCFLGYLWLRILDLCWIGCISSLSLFGPRNDLFACNCQSIFSSFSGPPSVCCCYGGKNAWMTNEILQQWDRVGGFGGDRIENNRKLFISSFRWSIILLFQYFSPVVAWFRIIREFKRRPWILWEINVSHRWLFKFHPLVQAPNTRLNGRIS